MMRLLSASFALLGLLSMAVRAQPADWYKWASNIDGQLVCAQTSPGAGWTRNAQPYRDAHCSIVKRRAGETPAPA